MKRFRLSLLASFFCLAVSPVFAQETDWKSLGKPLDDDTKPMMDRYVYFNDTTTDKGVALDKPVLAPNDVIEWITQRIADCMTFSPGDYDAKTVTNRRYFTPKGYGEYIATLNSAQLPDVIKNKRFRLSSVVLEPPVITAKGVREEPVDSKDPSKGNQKIFVWQIDAPAILGYQGANLIDNKSYKVTIKSEIVRVPMQSDNTLVSLNAWRLEEYKPNIEIKTSP